MAKRESIDKIARSTHKKIVSHLASLGVTVGDIDGPSNDVGLFSLQALQAIESALDARGEKSAQAGNVSLPGSNSAYAADQMDTGKKSK